jgi:nucleotide-binding universal stress UspA family protein
VADPLQQPWMVASARIDFGALQRAWVDAATHEFQALMKRRRLDSSTVKVNVVIGRPDAEIVRFAQEHGADLIVMGTHGYNGVKRLLLGSVADHVVRLATCPVLVVPSRLSRDDQVEADAARREATVVGAGVR